MKREALFDTNVVRSLSYVELEAVNKRYRARWKLTASPITFLELLLRARESHGFAGLRKLRFFDLRQSPFDEVLHRAGKPMAHKWWTTNSAIAAKVIRIACSSRDAEDFLKRTFHFDNHQYTIQEFSSFAALQLRALYNEFSTLIDMLKTDIPRGRPDARQMMRFSVGMATELARSRNLRPEHLLDSFHFYTIYVFAKAVSNLGSSSPVQTNDSEDSLIALHVRLTRDLTFVTSDKRFSDALLLGLNTLLDSASGHLRSNPLTIMTFEQFKRAGH